MCIGFRCHAELRVRFGRSDKACGMWESGKEGPSEVQGGDASLNEGFAIGSGTKCGEKWRGKKNKKGFWID